ncbi:MAG: hypothetical protein GWP91_05550 [Rhodobacterales bacterium]|nr:hypothetical protein [Rhodobacterales bacterium]
MVLILFAFAFGNQSLAPMLLAGLLATLPVIGVVIAEERWNARVLASAGDVIAPSHWFNSFSLYIGLLVFDGLCIAVVSQISIPANLVGFFSVGSVAVAMFIPLFFLRAIRGQARHLPSRPGQLLLHIVWLGSLGATFYSYYKADTPLFAAVTACCFSLCLVLVAPRIQFVQAMSRGDLPAVKRALDSWRFTGVPATLRAEAFRALGEDTRGQEYLHDFIQWSGTQQAQLLADAATAQLDAGDFSQARAVAFAAVRMSADLPGGWAVLGQCDLAQSQVSRHTLRVFKEALQWHDRSRGTRYAPSVWYAQIARVHSILGAEV